MSEAKESNTETSPSRLGVLFPITEHLTETKTNKSIGVFTAGDAIGSNVLQMYEFTIRALEALEEYLNQCDQNDRTHGISSEVLEQLYANQDETSSLYNSCAEIVEKMNK